MVSVGYTLSSEEHPPGDLVDNARAAEEAGFDFVSISDHFHPWVSAQGHSPFVWSVLGAIANQGVDAERLERVLDEEIERIRSEGVSPEELEKARNQARAETIRGLQTALGVAEAIQEANFIHGDPAAVHTRLQALQEVDAEDLRRVANQYLDQGNRAVVITEPAAAGEGDR